MVGAMVIEIGGVLLALAVLPGLPWQQWRAALAANHTVEAAEIPPSLPPSGYGFQLDNQAAVQDRSFAPRTIPAPATQPRTFTAPPALLDQRPSLAQDRRVTQMLPELPAEPQRREYVEGTLDRASQQILDSLAQPWSSNNPNPAAVSERDLARRNEAFRAPPPRTAQNEQQYLRPEYPSTLPNNLPSNNLPSHTPAAPSTRFGNPSPAQPLQRSQAFAQPVIPLEPVAPKFQSDIAPQSYNAPQTYTAPQGYAAPQNYNVPQGYAAPNTAQAQVSPPSSYYAQQRPSFEGQNTPVERAPISNEYYTPRSSTIPPVSKYTAPSTSPANKFAGPSQVRPTGPRHVQY